MKALRPGFVAALGSMYVMAAFLAGGCGGSDPGQSDSGGNEEGAPANAHLVVTDKDTGAPLAGVRVVVDGVAVGTTDASGVVDFRSTEGVHDISCSLATYDDYSGTLICLAGDNNLSVTMTKHKNFKGNVICDRTRDPLKDVVVTVSGADGGTTSTDASGDFALTVGAGSHTVTFTDPTGLHDPQTATVVVTTGQDVDLAVALHMR